jgi:hypothetical protein
MFIKKIVIILVCLSIMAVAGCKKKSQPITEEQLKNDVNQAIETTSAYLRQQMDAAIANSKDMYSKLEDQTKSFLSDLENRSEEKWQTVKSDLEAKRKIAQQRFNEMKQTSADNFDRDKKAFDNAMQKLRDSLVKAKRDNSKKDKETEPNTKSNAPGNYIKLPHQAIYS